MIVVLIALWAASALLLLTNPHASGSRRLSAVAFFGGAGALAAVLDERIIPAVIAAYPDSHAAAERMLYELQAAMSVSSYYGVPYAFALFALAYRRPPLPAAWRRWLPAALLLPMLGCLLYTPYYTEVYPISFDVVVWWAVPYLLGGSLVVALRRPEYRGFDRTHAVVCLAVLPPVVGFALLNYVLPSLGFLRMWVYNTVWVLLGVATFLIGLFTYGFMGVRLAIDRRRLDTALQAVTSGTAILNHAIKNDVGKLRLFGDKIKAYAEETGQAELAADAGTMLAASRHIQEMIARVHRRTENLALRPEEVDLGALLRETLRGFSPRLGDVRLEEEIPAGWRCCVDPAQLAETIGNLVGNALEAMGGAGTLRVRLSATKRDWRIEIADSGPGMSREQAARALEPFYTTKGGTGGNFGLGLPYAYHVMRKHGGMLLLRSAPGVGTTVCLTFPKRAVRASTASVSESGASVTEGRRADG